MQIQTAPTHWARIYMAGALEDAERVCRAHCFSVGLCVTVTPTAYIYSGGQEAGFIVGFINYPRFPCSPEALDARAEVLAQLLADALHQRSFTIETPTETRWHSRALPFEQPERSEPLPRGAADNASPRSDETESAIKE